MRTSLGWAAGLSRPVGKAIFFGQLLNFSDSSQHLYLLNGEG